MKIPFSKVCRHIPFSVEVTTEGVNAGKTVNVGLLHPHHVNSFYYKRPAQMQIYTVTIYQYTHLVLCFFRWRCRRKNTANAD